MIRFFDVVFSFLGILFLFPVFIILLIVGFFDTGAPIFAQERVRKYKNIFCLV